jgi:hypothetical protein
MQRFPGAMPLAMVTLAFGQMEDNGLEQSTQSPGDSQVLESSVLKTTRADCESIETVFQLIPKLDSEQLKTLAILARQFAPKNAKPQQEENAVFQ